MASEFLCGAMIAVLAAMACLIAPRAEAQEERSNPDAIEAHDNLPSEILEARAAVAEGNYRRASRRLRRLIRADEYDQLGSFARHEASSLLGQAETALRNYSAAYAEFVRASESEHGTPEDWWYRIRLSVQAGVLDDMGTSLTTLARRWPEFLSATEARRQGVFYVVDALEESGQTSDTYIDVLLALHEAAWEPGALANSRHGPVLALHMLERGRLREALGLARRIESWSALLGMRVDRRFDELVRADSEWFDIDEAIGREVALLRASTADSPNLLEPVVFLSSALRDTQRLQEGADLLETVISRVEESGDPALEFDDADRMLPWLHDSYAHILLDLGRPEEALARLDLARRLTESGGPNVSQTINLAALHARLGNSNRAQAVINSLQWAAASPSDYGWLQVRKVILMAAVHEGRRNDVDRMLEQIRARAGVSPETYQEALLYAGRVEEAAAYLILRLRDPDLRTDALLDVQDYAGPLYPLGTPLVEGYREARRTMLARPDVQAAITAVGRVEIVPARKP